MKKIIPINCSPRTAWNAATLIRKAAKGAEEQGAEVKIIDLYKLEKFTGCTARNLPLTVPSREVVMRQML